MAFTPRAILILSTKDQLAFLHCVRGESRNGRGESRGGPDRFLGWSPVTHFVGRGVRTRAPLPCCYEQLCVPMLLGSVTWWSHPQLFSVEALVYRGCRAGTYYCNLVSRVRQDQCANACLRGFSCQRSCVFECASS